MANESVRLTKSDMLQKQDAFCTAFTTLGRIGDSARACGIHRQTHYDWLKNDETYRPRWEEAVVEHQEWFDKLILDRITRPEGNRGSDILAMFYGKAINPDKYREIAIVVDDKALDAVADLKRLMSKNAREKRAQQRDKPEVSVQEQADAVVRKKVGGKA